MCVRGRENFCLKEALKNVQRGRQKKKRNFVYRTKFRVIDVVVKFSPEKL